MEVIDAALATAGKPCDMGNDPSKYLERFEDWYEHTNLLADSIGVKHDNQKLKLILLWGGKDFRKFAKDAGVVTDGWTVDTLDEALTKIRTKFGDHVNLSMAMFKLMHASQGSKTVTEFAREVDELATQCQFDQKPYTKERAMKDAIIFGTSDDKVRQEALAKDYDLKQLMKSALGYEQSRKASSAIKATAGDDIRHVTYTQEDVDSIVARVMAGKYSTRGQSSGKPTAGKNKCRFCPPHYKPHQPTSCPAKGKTCVVCKQKNHFAGSSACTASAGSTVKTVSDAAQPETQYSFKGTGEKGETMGKVEVLEVGQIKETSQNNEVSVKLNGEQVAILVDSGCKRTLIPKEMYTNSMGPLNTTQVQLRPYGTNQYLQTIGEISACLQCVNGASINTTVYIVDGYRPEALLGDYDAKELGILKINPKGNKPNKNTTITPPTQATENTVGGITDNIRSAGIETKTTKDPEPTIPREEKAAIQEIISKFKSVIKEKGAGSGLMLDGYLKSPETVEFTIDPSVRPVNAPYRPPPLAYRERLSEHLAELRRSGKIEDVGPNEYCPWVSNVVITEKKQAGQIRMNIDMREPNKAILRTQRHIETVQEMRHNLKGACRFSELDLGHGYHQIALAEKSRYMSTFQTHEGLHRFKVLFFGASPASDLFHNRVKAALHGLKGVMSIHDNILVWGKTPGEHLENLEKCLQRMAERNLTARQSKCTFGTTSLTWFGWTFSASGMSADQTKVQAIHKAGKPENCEDVKSFLQACQFNARFMLESDQAYAQVTKPLRDLTKKNAHFKWTEECEESYQKILKAMLSETALRPFDPALHTILVTDASLSGIAASVFQELENGAWVPIDHASRSLTPCEQNYSQTERESLGQSWGMNIHRYYLLGIPFDSYTDHQPLLHIYNGRRKGNARVERHRLKVQEFKYTVKYLPGKENTCDYQSRHPVPLSEYSTKQMEDMVIDANDELCINSIITNDLPDAVTHEMIRQATKQDATMQKLIKCIQKGHINREVCLQEYRQIFDELTYAQGVILKGEKLVIPDSEVVPGTGKLRQLVVDLAHEGHQGAVKCKQLLRAKVWFPGIDRMVEEKVAGCQGCQATTYTPTRDPLKPTKLPDGPWQAVDMDFWGPLPTGESLLVIIDEYSRYPEVEFVHSTSAEAVVPHIDKVFSAHGFPHRVKTDGGPPFNGTGTHLYQQYMKWAGIKAMVVSPEDPEANGLAENFMKSLKKIWHISRIENKNFRQELYKFLRQYRSTPHSTTGKPPAELLFNRKIQTRLLIKQEPARDPQVRHQDEEAKAKQKQYKDNKSNVKPHNIQVGDQVLLRQRQSKTHSVYDPEPYRVTEVHGTQITATQGTKIRVRDAKLFKKVELQQTTNYQKARQPFTVHEQDEEFDFTTGQTQPLADPVAPPAIPPHREEGGAGLAANMPIHQAARAQQRQYQYPNRHLDPNIDPNMHREARRRIPPKQYDANTGQWI